MTQDGPRSDTLMLQLDDGTWMARVSLPGQVIEVAGGTGPNASSAS